jgi:hypothetical protein
MNLIAFDAGHRNLFFSKSQNGHSQHAKDLSGYQSCIVAFNIDTGKKTAQLGSCEPSKDKDSSDSYEFSLVTSAAIDLSNNKLTIADEHRTSLDEYGQLKAFPRFRIQVFSLSSLKRDLAFDNSLDHELMGLKDMGASNGKTYVLCTAWPDDESSVKIYSFGDN